MRFRSYYKFGFTRHPVDRLASAFDFLRRGGMNASDAAWSKRHLQTYRDLDDFAIRGLSKPAISSYFHFAPQHIYLCDEDLRCLVDYLGRFERLNEGFQDVCRHLGIEAELPRLNARPYQPTVRLSPDALAAVTTAYATDFQLFDYVLTE